ncbi:MAG: UDP-N-acetylmuramate dehydrogenase [SAR324 cluster bacterium]|nr:UDP-N-acetylmuramate dehydrogenase [SAR324 cluster bacterium]
MNWRGEIGKRLRDSQVRFDVPLRELTTLRIGGPADCLVDVESEGDLLALLAWLESEGIPFVLIGKGSNLLAPDAGLRGVAIRLGRGLSTVQRRAGTAFVLAGAGLANAAYVSRCRELGLGGMEYLVAIPGTIGGAVAMNAGAHDGETAAFLEHVRFYERGSGIRTCAAGEFPFAYRSSPLRGQLGRVVVAAEFRMREMSPETIRSREADFQEYRRRTQPREFPNCGSIFKNPPGDFAGRLVEQAGLKGHRLGGAQVSEKHANFIVNREGANAADVLELIDLLRESVYQEAGVGLELEMQVMDTEGRFASPAQPERR